MPWRIDRIKDGKFKLYNLDKKKYVKVDFKTQSSAKAARKNYSRYTYGR